MRLSNHFTLEELTHSDVAIRKGIDNTPDAITLDNLTLLASNLEHVRAALGGVPILISSGYRSPKLNAAVGGSKTSAHMRGLACDFTAPEFGTPRDVAEHLAGLRDSLKFEQLILEGGRWIHYAVPEFPFAGKGEILTAAFGPGGVTYSRGLA